MSGWFSGFMPPKAGFRRRTCKRRHLSRALETGFGSPRPKDVAWRKIRLFADSMPAYAAQITKRPLTEFRFRRIGRHIRRTWIRWTSTPGVFCRQKPKLCLTQISAPYISPLQRNRTGKRRSRSAKHRFLRRRCQRRHLPRAFETACGPLDPEGRSLMENSPFGGFSAGLRRLNQLAAVGGILVFSGLAAIFAGLEFAGLFNQQRLAAKRSGYASR